jgi:hypothetical protein
MSGKVSVVIIVLLVVMNAISLFVVLFILERFLAAPSMFLQLKEPFQSQTNAAPSSGYRTARTGRGKKMRNGITTRSTWRWSGMMLMKKMIIDLGRCTMTSDETTLCYLKV